MITPNSFMQASYNFLLYLWYLYQVNLCKFVFYISWFCEMKWIVVVVLVLVVVYALYTIYIPYMPSFSVAKSWHKYENFHPERGSKWTYF